MRKRIPLFALMLAAAFGLPAVSEEVQCRVSVLPLGSDTKRETLAVGTRTFISRLDGRPGFAATNAPPPSRWDACPEGVKPGQWVSLVPVCFGSRADWLAFGFDKDGKPLAAVRRPARLYDTAGIFPENIAPGDKQIDRNAGIELAADYAVALAAPAGGPGVRLTVETGPAEGDQALPLMPAELEGVRALAVAAALQAGRRPGVEPAAEEWTLSVSKTPSGFGLRLTAKKAGGSPGPAVKVRCPLDAVYPYLVRLARAASGWGKDVSDFIVADPGGVRLMGWRDEILYVDLGGAMAAFPAASGLVEWTATEDARYRPAFTWGPWSATNGAPFSYHPNVSRVGKRGGIPKGPSGEDTLPWGFDLMPDGGVLVARDLTLYATEPNTFKARWSWMGGDRLTGGPLVAGTRVFAGGLSGELAALNLADGRLVWRTQVVERLSGPFVGLGDRVAAPSVEGVLIAFRSDTGAVAWRADLGDTLAGRPVVTPHGLLAFTRSGRVALIDPVSGAIRSSWEGGALSAGGAVQGDSVVWAGREGRVILLKLPDLAMVRETALKTRLTDGVLAVADAPHVWGAGDEFGNRGPVALVADEEGFVYVLPIP